MSDEKSGNEATRSDFLQRHFLWLLLATYALASLWPGPGLAMRHCQWRPSAGHAAGLSLPLVLLALILFCAAVLTDVQQIRSVLSRPLVLCVALVAVWLGPALLVVIAGIVIPWAVAGKDTVGLLVGLTLVATMPVANSSVGWTQNARGNLALGLALVVVSISLSPWVTPHLLALLANSLSPGERAYCLELITRFSGWFFIVWVLLPTAGGFLFRFIASSARIAVIARWLVLINGAALLALNYINSALALPNVLRRSDGALVFATATLAVALSAVGLIFGFAMARLMNLTPEARSAVLFGLSMKHTGLALILAGAVPDDRPLAILMIVLATLTQHLLVGAVQWWLVRRAAAHPLTSA